VQLARVLILLACGRNLVDFYKVSHASRDGLYITFFVLFVLIDFYCFSYKPQQVGNR